MSQMEYHSGKLRKIDRLLPLNEFCEELCKKAYIKERKSYNKNWVEQVQDSFNDKYFIHDGEIYEFLEHIKANDEWEEIKITKGKGDELIFFGAFYNGGCCLEECLTEAFEKFEDEK